MQILTKKFAKVMISQSAYKNSYFVSGDILSYYI